MGGPGRAGPGRQTGHGRGGNFWTASDTAACSQDGTGSRTGSGPGPTAPCGVPSTRPSTGPCSCRRSRVGHPYGPEIVDAARRAALVEDPRLQRVLAAGEERGTAYVVLERLSGRTLVDLLGTGPLPAETARRIVGEAAQALDRAAARGLHHLRLRPDQPDRGRGRHRDRRRDRDRRRRRRRRVARPAPPRPARTPSAWSRCSTRR